MKLGLQLGYWGASKPAGALERMLAAEKLGFDIAFTAEAWGSDCFSPLAWWGSRTERIRLGTSIAQLAGRTPTATAMAALTMDHLSDGRFVLGLGVSGPQVVEGWYGQPFAKPLARTREYIDVIHQVLARKGPVTSDGPHYPLPYTGPGSIGKGKPLKPITHPLRADIPIWLGAEGPKNVALTAEIADGWLPIYYSPRVADTYKSWLEEGFARSGEAGKAQRFEIASNCQVVVTNSDDETAAARNAMKPIIAFYIGGMGARDMNFHADVFARMGYEDAVEEIQELFFAGDRDKTMAIVPDQLIDDISLIGPKEKIRDDLAEWEAAGITMLVVGATSVEQMAPIADAVLG